jgi:hypothetical protein
MILMANAYKGSEQRKVGFEDADRTITMLANEINALVPVEQDALESALWSANLMNEQKKFWHPKGYTFEEYLGSLGVRAKFDKKYNLIK